jgi:hypothetical protein
MTSDSAPIVRTGGCACGRLRFRAHGEPLRVGLCHCLTCRKVSGSAFNAFVMFAADQVDIEGEFEPWATSATHDRCFCSGCGSQTFARELATAEVEIKLGAFDEPNLFLPTYEAWAARREGWLHIPGLRAYERNREDG